MMRPISLAELQQRFGGSLWLGAAEDQGSLRFSQLETDSRADLTGKVFLALKGERFDGHVFCQQAVEQGAAALVVSEHQPGLNIPQWCVPDTRIALGQIALFNRDLYQGPLVAITGNSGKTTVKEMLGSVLAAEVGQDAVLITAGNFNNDIGVPLTLLRLAPEHRFAVLELGANHLGEIAYSASLAKPDVGVVLNVTGAHLGEFGSMERIAQAKGELIQALSPEGVVVINADDHFSDFWNSLAGERSLTRYSVVDSSGTSRDTDVTHTEHVGLVQACRPQSGADGYRFELCTAGFCLPVALQVPARHNVSNAAAAAAAALRLGISPETIVAGLSAFSGVKGRLQTVTGHQQSRIINDSYNANPGSVRAAIDTLMDYAGTHILVLGDIGELGADAESAHAALGIYAREKEVDHLFTTGKLTRLTAESYGVSARHFESQPELVDALKPLLTAETTVLVKGSRSARMEKVVEGLMQNDPASDGA